MRTAPRWLVPLLVVSVALAAVGASRAFPPGGPSPVGWYVTGFLKVRQADQTFDFDARLEGSGRMLHPVHADGRTVLVLPVDWNPQRAEDLTAMIRLDNGIRSGRVEDVTIWLAEYGRLVDGIDVVKTNASGAHYDFWYAEARGLAENRFEGIGWARCRGKAVIHTSAEGEVLHVILSGLEHEGRDVTALVELSFRLVRWEH